MYFLFTLHKGWVLYLKILSGSMVPLVLDGFPWAWLLSTDQVDVSSERELSLWVFLWWKAITQEGNMIPVMCPWRALQECKKCEKNLPCLWSITSKLLIFHWPKQVTYISPKSVVWKSLLCKETLTRRAVDKQSWTNLTYWGGICMFALFSFIFVYFLPCTSLYFSNLV